MNETARPPWYGTTPAEPVRLSSVAASRLFLNALVTYDGLHIVYHRLESVSYETILDHYEIMDASGHYGDIYISIYHGTNGWIPPVGYLFDPGVLFYAGSTDEYSGLTGGEPGLDVTPDFIFNDWMPGGACKVAVPASEVALPLYLEESFGVTSRVEGFPFPLLKKMLENHPLASDGEIPEILAMVRARNQSARH